MTFEGHYSSLPQHFYSDFAFERFLSDAHFEDNNTRAVNEIGRKYTDEEEIDIQGLDYFINNHKKFSNEFFKELSKRTSKKTADKFCSQISEQWSDGRDVRLGPDILPMMKSIHNYLLEFKHLKKRPETIKVYNLIDSEIKSSYTTDEIDQIISLNKEMADIYLVNWQDYRHNKREQSTDETYIYRGIGLKENVEKKEYYEYHYINSYSIASSVVEKFAQMQPNRINASLSQNYYQAHERILFFAPFIPKMEQDQFELGIIPHFYTLKMYNQGVYGGITEYLIG